MLRPMRPKPLMPTLTAMKSPQGLGALGSERRVARGLLTAPSDAIHDERRELPSPGPAVPSPCAGGPGHRRGIQPSWDAWRRQIQPPWAPRQGRPGPTETASSAVLGAAAEGDQAVQ